MNNTSFQHIIEKLKQTLISKYPDFRGIYFYGSRVREENLPESDYDIVAVFDREINWTFEKEILDIVYEFLVANDIVIDCRVYSLEEILNPATPFRQNVKKEGLFYGV